MVGIVIVSHSRLAALGIRDLASQMAGPDARIIACGGMEDGSMGTDAARIMEALLEADSGDGVCAMVDLGSGIMSTEVAIELLEMEDSEAGGRGGIRVRIADAPVLEGAVSAAVAASAGDCLADVVAAAEEARGFSKLGGRSYTC